MMRLLCTLGCVAVLSLSAPPLLAQDAGEGDAGDAGAEPEEDAGYDAGFDADYDAGFDAGYDAGAPPTDAGEPPTDAGQTPTDAGQTPTDAGQTPTDAGQTPTDAGLEPPDAGPLPRFDAGRPGDECEPRCIDERRAGRCSSTGQLVPLTCGADEACEIDRCVPAALADTTGCACRQGGGDATMALFALLLGARLLRRRARGRELGARS